MSKNVLELIIEATLEHESSKKRISLKDYVEFVAERRKDLVDYKQDFPYLAMIEESVAAALHYLQLNQAGEVQGSGLDLTFTPRLTRGLKKYSQPEDIEQVHDAIIQSTVTVGEAGAREHKEVIMQYLSIMLNLGVEECAPFKSADFNAYFQKIYGAEPKEIVDKLRGPKKELIAEGFLIRTKDHDFVSTRGKYGGVVFELPRRQDVVFYALERKGATPVTDQARELTEKKVYKRKHKSRKTGCKRTIDTGRAPQVLSKPFTPDPKPELETTELEVAEAQETLEQRMLKDSLKILSVGLPFSRRHIGYKLKNEYEYQPKEIIEGERLHSVLYKAGDSPDLEKQTEFIKLEDSPKDSPGKSLYVYSLPVAEDTNPIITQRKYIDLLLYLVNFTEDSVYSTEETLGFLNSYDSIDPEQQEIQSEHLVNLITHMHQVGLAEFTDEKKESFTFSEEIEFCYRYLQHNEPWYDPI